MELQLVFVITSVLTFFFIIFKIRKNGLNIDDSIVWIFWAIMLLVLSFFPKLATIISNKLGFISTSNFILSLFVFFSYILLFVQSIQISKLKEKQKEFIQKLSILRYQNNKKDN